MSAKTPEPICKNCQFWSPVRGHKTADGSGQRAGKCGACKDGFRWFGENRRCDQKMSWGEGLPPEEAFEPKVRRARRKKVA